MKFRDGAWVFVIIMLLAPTGYVLFPDHREFIKMSFTVGYGFCFIISIFFGIGYLISRVTGGRGIGNLPGYLSIVIGAGIGGVGLYEALWHDDWGGFVVAGVGAFLIVIVKWVYVPGRAG